MVTEISVLQSCLNSLSSALVVEKSPRNGFIFFKALLPHVVPQPAHLTPIDPSLRLAQQVELASNTFLTTKPMAVSASA